MMSISAYTSMIMDVLSALALAAESPSDELMKRPPGGGENFITKVILRNTIGQSIFQLIVLGLLMFDGKRLLKISAPDADSILNTFILYSFVFCQVDFCKFYQFICVKIKLQRKISFWAARTSIVNLCQSQTSFSEDFVSCLSKNN